MAIKNRLKTLRETDKNPFETAMDLGSDVTKSVREDLFKEGGRDFMKQLLGLEDYAAKTAAKMEGDLREGEEVHLSKGKSEKPSRAEGAIDYRRDILHAETIHAHAENRELRQKLEEIQVELKKITETSKELEVTFKAVARESMVRTVKPGKYHVNFFEWMLATIQSARVRIESSASWIGALSGKKAKKDYWSLSQSHGTSYSLSSERAVAQQVG